MSGMYRINQPQHVADEHMKINSMTSGLQVHACKDCDEWTCVTCDNENCPNQEKEPGCYTGDCTKQGDLKPKCKDCDEWTCITCDNE